MQRISFHFLIQTRLDHSRSGRMGFSPAHGLHSVLHHQVYFPIKTDIFTWTNSFQLNSILSISEWFFRSSFISNALLLFILFWKFNWCAWTHPNKTTKYWVVKWKKRIDRSIVSLYYFIIVKIETHSASVVRYIFQSAASASESWVK